MSPYTALFLFRTFVKANTVCYHVLSKTNEDVNVRTVFKILLAPMWLLLAHDLFPLIIGNGSKELMLQLLTIGSLLIAVPLVAGFIVGLLEAAQEPIIEFIES